MTDAPKIDAKAPDTSRDWPEWMDLGKQRCGWSNIAAEPGNMMRYIRADVAAAREAAAVERAFRDGLTYGAICEVTDQDEAWRTSQARARLEDGQAALGRLIAERVREATAELRGLLWLACHEFNAIRARSGAPLDYQGMTTVSEEWWDQMTRAFADAVGPDAKKPWPSEEAKAVTAKIAARGSKEGRDG